MVTSSRRTASTEKQKRPHSERAFFSHTGCEATASLSSALQFQLETWFFSKNFSLLIALAILFELDSNFEFFRKFLIFDAKTRVKSERFFKIKMKPSVQS